MQTFLGVILGAVLVVGGVYIYDSMTTSSVANGQVVQLLDRYLFQIAPGANGF